MALSSEELDKIKLNDINGKLKIVHNVILACKAEAERKKLAHDVNNVRKRVMYYTNAEDFLIMRSYSLLRFRQTPTNRFCTPLNMLEYKYIREVYVFSYLTKAVMPTIDDFKYQWTNHKKRIHKVVTERFKESGFTWVKIPGTTKCLIVEKASQVRSKCEYLSKIAQYRDEGRNIVYVSKRAARNSLLGSTTRSLIRFAEIYQVVATKTPEYYFLIAASKNGLLDISSFTSNDDDNLVIQSIADLSSKVKSPTVFVLVDKTNLESNGCPAPHSSKKTMSEFLTRNNIPHDENSPKAELYSLIQKCEITCNSDYHKLDEIVKSYGNVILRRPYVLRSLDFFEDAAFLLRNKIKHVPGNAFDAVKTIKNEVIATLNARSSEYWEKIEENIIEQENQIYTEDVKIEEIVDKILMMAKDCQLTESVNLKDLDDYLYADVCVEKIVVD